jgi:hypothetical protein
MGIVKMSDDQMLHPIGPAVNKNHLPEDVRHVKVWGPRNSNPFSMKLPIGGIKYYILQIEKKESNFIS